MAPKIKRKKPLYKRIGENKVYQSTSTIVLPVALGVLIFILWQTQILHGWFNTDEFTLPVPTRIANITLGNMGKIMENVQATVIVALVGLVIGSVVGYLFSVLAALFPTIGKGGLTVVGAFASIPIVALAPVMNNWTKDVSKEASFRSMISKIIVVALVAAANMSLNAYRGLTDLKPYSIDLMATYAAGKFKTLYKLRLPNSLPYVFTALKVSVPASIITAIISEYFAEYIIGVGRQIRENILLAQYSTAWAYIAVACILGIIMYVILMLAQHILLRKYH